MDQVTSPVTLGNVTITSTPKYAFYIDQNYCDERYLVYNRFAYVKLKLVKRLACKDAWYLPVKIRTKRYRYSKNGYLEINQSKTCLNMIGQHWNARHGRYIIWFHLKHTYLLLPIKINMPPCILRSSAGIMIMNPGISYEGASEYGSDFNFLLM